MRGGVAFLLAFPSLHVSPERRHACVHVFFLLFRPAEVRASSLSIHRICQNSYVLLVLVNYESG